MGTLLLSRIYSKSSRRERFFSLDLEINERLCFDVSERIFFMEFEVMNRIGFDLNVDLPFKYLEIMNGYIKQYLPSLEIQISKCIGKLIDQIYIFPICLYFEPLLLVLACYSIVLCKIKFPDLPDNKQWFTLIDPMIDYKIISEIAELVLGICKRKTEGLKPSKPLDIFIYKNSFKSSQKNQLSLNSEVGWRLEEETANKSEFTLKGIIPDQGYSEKLTSNDTLSNNDERMFFEENNTKIKLKLSNEVV